MVYETAQFKQWCMKLLSLNNGVLLTVNGNPRRNDTKYSQTSLIHASLIRVPHNPNTVPVNLL